jgi:hypothetical protein
MNAKYRQLPGRPAAYRADTGMGQEPTSPAPRSRPASQEDFKNFIETPAWYTVSLLLGGNVNDNIAGAAALRPERYVLRRITWATNGDTPAFGGFGFGSVQGRSVEVSWGDEFTQFLGQQPSLLSALFGDSDGFLDLPGEGLLFQGRQSLNVKLRRIFWPGGAQIPAAETRFDVTFHGLGLLPKNSGGFSGGA